jgi:hypothetical protein
VTEDVMAALEAAVEERDRVRRLDAEARRNLAEAVRAARTAGVPVNDIIRATGLTRQRIWQIVRAKR